jgi:hypothetical protein
MPVKQSASKEDFLVAIGLNMQRAEDKQKLVIMWVSTPPLPQRYDKASWSASADMDARTRSRLTG